MGYAKSFFGQLEELSLANRGIPRWIAGYSSIEIAKAPINSPRVTNVPNKKRKPPIAKKMDPFQSPLTNRCKVADTSHF